MIGQRMRSLITTTGMRQSTVESSRMDQVESDGSSRVIDCMHASVHPHLIGVKGVLLAEVNANICGSR